MTASQSLESTAVYSDLTRTESDAGPLVFIVIAALVLLGEPLKGMIYGPLSNEGT